MYLVTLHRHFLDRAARCDTTIGYLEFQPLRNLEGTCGLTRKQSPQQGQNNNETGKTITRFHIFSHPFTLSPFLPPRPARQPGRFQRLYAPCSTPQPRAVFPPSRHEKRGHFHSS